MSCELMTAQEDDGFLSGGGETLRNESNHGFWTALRRSKLLEELELADSWRLELKGAVEDHQTELDTQKTFPSTVSSAIIVVHQLTWPAPVQRSPRKSKFQLTLIKFILI